ncbi:hypothetical protein GWI33_016552 [Rhynchophorus ferrugineus]|uniref:Odorant receptor n=1 Tax=Rhynchophorus ferrugineus TaxID=354439 RepID=A0A834HXU4_RHYFE|nr:hypothetical protein GWI33_016552 [Rhynchophorus ferrugineus]
MLRYTLQNLNHFESIDGVLVERRAKIDCNDSGFVDVMSENMKICIETYHEIKLLSKISQDMFHLGLFIVSLGGGVILCCILFQLLYSEMLHETILNIPNWIDCGVTFQKMMIMFLIYVEKPIIIYIGRIIPLSLDVIVNARCSHHSTIIKKSRALSVFLVILGNILGATTQVFWSIKPYFDDDFRLPTRAWYPYNYTKSPYYHLTSIQQTLSSGYLIVHTINLDIFVDNLILTMGAQCDILRYNMENLTRFEVKNEVLLERTDEISRNDKNFVPVMNNNIIVCLKTFSEIRSMLFEQSVSCILGSGLTMKSEKLYNAVVRIPHWIDCDIKFKKIMIMFLIYLEKPIVIYIGRIIPLSVAVIVNTKPMHRIQ